MTYFRQCQSGSLVKITLIHSSRMYVTFSCYTLILLINDVHVRFIIKSNITFLFYSQKVRKWIKLFLSLGGKVKGYEKTSITPYLHILVYHLPRFLKNEILFKAFTGQGVEKVNDIVRSTHPECLDSRRNNFRQDNTRRITGKNLFP